MLGAEKKTPQNKKPNSSELNLVISADFGKWVKQRIFE